MSCSTLMSVRQTFSNARQRFPVSFGTCIRRSISSSVPDVPFTHLLHPSQSHPLVKSWNTAPSLQASQMMYPIFISDQAGVKEEIKSLPGQYRWGVDRLEELLDPLVEKGLRSVLLFGVLTGDSKKDATASWADRESSPVPRALLHLRQKYRSLLLATDVCLCGYTSTGHCCILDAEMAKAGVLRIQNPASIERLAQIALSYAQYGAHMVAPSDMMDGRIGAIKHLLRGAGLESQVPVMSYTAKFASVFYGPFRDAACSGMSFGDRSSYQLGSGSRGLALRALVRDVAEGADIVMVKPGGPYLDIVRDCRERVSVPIAIYQVSGEYAMLYHAAKAGAFGLEEGVLESLVCAQRAGADIFISYFTPLVLNHLAKCAQK
eukprot:gb/GEZN01010112.1/.p1 GENE.gb/GEZN01010112.1/~~gb/GEZN01010112.1/.p1  ORF type:complete len:377 (-),score=14.75 gb/GEZN01010112.1/:59-1189(-)